MNTGPNPSTIFADRLRLLGLQGPADGRRTHRN